MPSYEHSPVHRWTKTIQQSRDRMQGIVLVSATTIFLLPLALIAAIGLSTHANLNSPQYCLATAAISALFAVIVAVLRSATVAGAIYGALLCFCITAWSTLTSPNLLHTELPALFTLFAISFLATRTGRRKKQKLEVAESKKGRTASQVAANLSIAALALTPLGYYFAVLLHLPLANHHILLIVSMAALAEATSDTVSSELGQVFGGCPYLLTTLKPVPIGTDGAVTPLGTLFGILAAAIVICVAAITLPLSSAESAIALIASTIGLFADSLIGATLERKGYLGNDLVNFISTLVAAISAAMILKLVF